MAFCANCGTQLPDSGVCPTCYPAVAETPQQNVSSQPFPPQGYPPQDYQPPAYPPQDYQPPAYPPQDYQQPAYPPQDYQQQPAYPPQDYQQQLAYPPQDYQQQPSYPPPQDYQQQPSYPPQVYQQPGYQQQGYQQQGYQQQGYQQGYQQQGYQQQSYQQGYTPPPGGGRSAYGKIRGPVACILLSIITCGIYYLYWSWVTNKQINDLYGRQVVGSGMIVLGWFCFPVMWYNWYKWDQGLQDICPQYNVRYSANFILWLILTIFVGIGMFIMTFQVQDALNRVYGE